MTIDFSSYEPGTVLRVECRDGVMGCLHPHASHAGKFHLLVRDGGGTNWLNSKGRIWSMSDEDEDVIRIIARMVEAAL